MSKKKTKRRGRGEGGCFYSESKQCWIGRPIIGKTAKGKPIRKEVTAQSKGEVLAKMRTEQEKAVAQAPAGANEAVPTFGAYLRSWLDGTARSRVEETTWSGYDQRARVQILPRLGDHLLTAVTAERLEAFFDELTKEGIAPGTLQSIRAVMSSCLRHAVKKGRLAASPLESVDRPKQRDREIEPFTTDEARAILGAAEHDNRFGAMFAIALGSGARLSELLALGKEHLDITAGLMRIERALYRNDEQFKLKPPKSKRGRRTVLLPRFALEAIARHIATGRQVEGGPFFPSNLATWEHRSVVALSWKACLKRAKVRFRRQHNCRHTHVSQLLAAGVSLVEVARRIGDRPETVLAVYAHFLPGEQNVPALLDRLYGRQGGEKVEA